MTTKKKVLLTGAMGYVSKRELIEGVRNSTMLKNNRAKESFDRVFLSTAEAIDEGLKQGKRAISYAQPLQQEITEHVYAA